jgi:hypothetical protein
VSKRLDPTGLAGAFAKKASSSSALDFLVPVRAQAKPEPVAVAPLFVVPLDGWSPAAPPARRVGPVRRVVHRVQRLVGRVLRVAL